MKRLLFFLTAALFITACQKDEGGGGGQAPTQTADTPLNRSCLDGTTFCNNQVYNQNQGWMAYPGMYNYAYNYANQFQYGFCDCPWGYQPTYNGTHGLGCVNAQYLNQYSGFFQTWNWNTGNTGWGYAYGYQYSAPQTEINFPQYSNIPGSRGNGSCHQQVTQSCILSEPNNCGNGATCRPVIGNSNLGVCVNH